MGTGEAIGGQRNAGAAARRAGRPVDPGRETADPRRETDVAVACGSDKVVGGVATTEAAGDDGVACVTGARLAASAAGCDPTVDAGGAACEPVGVPRVPVGGTAVAAGGAGCESAVATGDPVLATVAVTEADVRCTVLVTSAAACCTAVITGTAMCEVVTGVAACCTVVVTGAVTCCTVVVTGAAACCTVVVTGAAACCTVVVTGAVCDTVDVGGGDETDGAWAPGAVPVGVEGLVGSAVGGDDVGVGSEGWLETVGVDAVTEGGGVVGTVGAAVLGAT